MPFFKTNAKKRSCLIMATEAYLGQGRNMEIYYRTLIPSTTIEPVMIYTDRYAYANAPNWVTSKILTAIKKTDHALKDCRKFSCSKPPGKHRTSEQWNREYIPYVIALRSRFGERALWLRDSTNEAIERYMGRYIIQVFHGELFDTIQSYFVNESERTYSRFWTLFTPGRLLKNRIVRKLKLSPQDQRIRSIGRVVSDTLYNGEIKRDSVLKSYGLSPQKKTLIYAPSWESGKIWPIGKPAEDQNQLFKFCRLTEKMGINLILRPHPVSVHHHGVKKIYLQAGKNFKNVFFDDTTHSSFFGPNKSLVAADILITDISSIAIDFMSLGKPSIFLYPNTKGRLWGRLPSYDRVKKVSYAVRTFPELFLLIKKLLIYQETPSVLANRKQVVKFVLEKTNGTSGDIFRRQLELEIEKSSFRDYLNKLYLKRFVLFNLRFFLNQLGAKKTVITSMIKTKTQSR